MLRISEMDNGNGHVVLKLEGRLIGPWVGELQSASERILDNGKPLKLDLAEVSFVDREGVRLLREFGRRQIALERCSPFIMEELK